VNSADASQAATGLPVQAPTSTGDLVGSPETVTESCSCVVASAAPLRPGCFVVSGAEGVAGGRANGVFVPCELPGYTGVRPFAKEGDETLAMMRWAGKEWVICDTGPNRNRFPNLCVGSEGTLVLAGEGSAVELFRIASTSDTPPTGTPWPLATGQFVWEVEMGSLEGRKRWMAFEARVARELEQARSKGSPAKVSFSLRDAGEAVAREYEVDLVTMVQTNLSGQMTRARPVRRIHRADKLVEPVEGLPASSTVPRCPNSRHNMEWSDGTGFYSSYLCNACGASASGHRWFCSVCQQDLCNSCCAGPSSLHPHSTSLATTASAPHSPAVAALVGKRVQLKASAGTMCMRTDGRSRFTGPERLAGVMVTVLGVAPFTTFLYKVNVIIN
jgi:hypothetical protein